MDIEHGANENHEYGNQDQEISEARRRALSHAIPFAVGVLSKAQEALSPLSMASKAVGKFDAMTQQDLVPLNNFLKSKLSELQYLDLRSEGQGRYILTITRESFISTIVSQYLRMNLREDSAFVSPFHLFPPSHGSLEAESYDCELALAPGSVFGRLIKESPKPGAMISIQSMATSGNRLSEIWFFVTSGLKKGEEDDLLLDPTYVTERKFLPGRVMVVGLNAVFEEVFGKEQYIVLSVESETRNDEQERPVQIFKTTFQSAIMSQTPDKERVNSSSSTNNPRIDV